MFAEIVVNQEAEHPGNRHAVYLLARGVRPAEQVQMARSGFEVSLIRREFRRLRTRDLTGLIMSGDERQHAEQRRDQQPDRETARANSSCRCFSR